MKNLINNKYVLIGLALLVGSLVGWLIKPGNGGSNLSSDHSIDEHSGEEVWTCSMHPQIREDGPGKCPLCGMDLIPVSTMESDAVGLDEIQMTESAAMIADIQTVTVRQAKPEKQVYLPGIIKADERNIATVTAHFDGRVEKLYADFTGQYIRKGQKLATLYSPDLVTAQKELFEALKFKKRNPSFYEAAIQKLKLWELTDDQIEAIIQKGEPHYYIDVFAPRSGTITARKITEGEHVMNGKVLFEIANLNSLWVMFDAYESDLPWIKVGDSVSFQVQSIPGKTFKSRITFIDPVVNNNSRTSSVRTEVRNQNNLLKPDMFVDGIINAGLSGLRESLLIPKTAILWTGKRAVVYVKRPGFEQPTFQFREIELGPEAADFYVVKSGLSEGEEVASNGVFKIDAAAQLQGKISMMNPAGGKTSRGHDHGGMQMDDMEETIEGDHPEVNVTIEQYEVSVEFKKQLKTVFDNYMSVKDALVATNADQARNQARPLLSSINDVDMRLVEGEAHHEWMKDLSVLRKSAEKITGQNDVQKMREALSPLSDQLYHTLSKFQVETGGYRQYCPMAFDNKGAFWLSSSEEVLNPYFGDVMLNCGTVEEELK